MTDDAQFPRTPGDHCLGCTTCVQYKQVRDSPAPVGSKCLKGNDETNGIPSEWLRVGKGFHLATAMTCLPWIFVCPMLDQALCMYWLIHDGIWLLFFRAERIIGIKGNNRKPGCKSGLRSEELERASSDFACLKISQGHGEDTAGAGGRGTWDVSLCLSSWRSVLHCCYFCSLLMCFASHSSMDFVCSFAFKIKTMNLQAGNGLNTQCGVCPASRISYTSSVTPQSSTPAFLRLLFWVGSWTREFYTLPGMPLHDSRLLSCLKD